MESEFVDDMKYVENATGKISKINYNVFVDKIENGSIKVENWGTKL